MILARLDQQARRDLKVQRAIRETRALLAHKAQPDQPDRKA